MASITIRDRDFPEDGPRVWLSGDRAYLEGYLADPENGGSELRAYRSQPQRWTIAIEGDPQDERKTVTTCEVCGGRYRPAGGPCIHEHPQGKLRQSGPICCLVCGVSWYPGHACIVQPSAVQVYELAELGSVLRLMDDILARLGDELGVAAPAAWEAV